MMIKGMEQQVDQTSHEYLDFTFSPHGVQLRIMNFILSYFLSVIVGAISVLIFYKI
jgi:hypothetical protein